MDWRSAAPAMAPPPRRAGLLRKNAEQHSSREPGARLASVPRMGKADIALRHLARGRPDGLARVFAPGLA